MSTKAICFKHVKYNYFAADIVFFRYVMYPY